MARLDTSRAGELRVLAEKLRRHASEMTLIRYIDMMERAAGELDREAGELEAAAILSQRATAGRHVNILI